MLTYLPEILVLVRPPCLVHIEACGRRRPIYWFDRNIWNNIQHSKSNSRLGRYLRRFAPAFIRLTAWATYMYAEFSHIMCTAS